MWNFKEFTRYEYPSGTVKNVYRDGTIKYEFADGRKETIKGE